MADPCETSQADGSGPAHIQNSNQIDTDVVYDLDDPYFIPRLLNGPPVSAGTITCRFLALPLAPGTFPVNLAQYGRVLLESRNKLVMRVPGHMIGFLDQIRAIWVSKYMALGTECRLTFGPPGRDAQKSSLIIVQRVRHKDNKDRTGSVTSDGSRTTTTATTAGDSEVPADDTGSVASLSCQPPPDARDEALPHRIQRRRANSLPEPSLPAMDELRREAFAYPGVTEAQTTNT
ncbi:hypothetical protein F4777DRAFT_577953 [Nemania sp. FL0916]|nr:hypothetical protein F4777DRAFT_577953 [Nemania sp. FL0916]